MSAICGYTWKGAGQYPHECMATDPHEEYVRESHVCKCGASIGVREAARYDELRKEAAANFAFYNDIEEQPARMGETAKAKERE